MIYYRTTAPLKVFLSRIDELDLPLMFHERNDYANYRYFRQNAPLHINQHVDWAERQASDPSMSMFRVHVWSGYKKNPDGQEVPHSARIGTVGLTSLDMVNRRGEFSIIVDRQFHGGGYGRDALISILGHGFLDLGLNVIWGEVFENNPALGLFQAVGFQLEGKRRDFYYRDGRYVDACLVSMRRSEFDSLYNLERIASFPKDLKCIK